MLQRLGFSRRFNADGSMYFTGNRMKVEFVTKERRDGTRPPRTVKDIALTPQVLGYLDILLADPVVLRLGQGIRARVPSPSAFSCTSCSWPLAPSGGRRAKRTSNKPSIQVNMLWRTHRNGPAPGPLGRTAQEVEIPHQEVAGQGQGHDAARAGRHRTADGLLR